ncbi:MAG: class I tRNA ligase family protein, partial [Eubacteriales bacterium]|nr:class I tRNA ligase family protein [Eubacteriales bacterium]
PDRDSVKYADMNEADKWALQKLKKLVSTVGAAFETYEFHQMFHAIHNFCVVDMSNFYLDIVKDRLYASGRDEHKRRSAQTAMWTILDSLVRMLVPVLAFTTEEIWQNMPHRACDDNSSVQMNSWPLLEDVPQDEELYKKWQQISELRELVSKALEEARNKKTIGHSLGAKVVISASGEKYSFIFNIKDMLPEILIVSDFEIREGGSFKIEVEPAGGVKCERCWIYSEDTGKSSAHPALCPRCISVIEGLKTNDGA